MMQVFQTWNYASLQNNQQDTTTFLNAAGTPYAVQFPGSNIVILSGSGVTFIVRQMVNGFFNDGIVDPGSGFILHYNPARLLVPVPFTYSSNLVHTARLQVDTTVTGFSLRIVEVTQQTFTGDGYGSLQLPNGTYPSTLRIKDVEHNYDSTYADFGFGYTLFGTPTQSQTTNYYWVRNGAGAMLLQISADSLGAQATGGASYFLSSGPTGIADITPFDAKNTYPNPSSDFVTIDLGNLSGQAEILYVYDITGRQIDAMNIKNIDRNTFDVRNYDNGRYIVRITGDNMQPVTSSFTVAH